MQKLRQYITDLLLLHDCVIVPQFGGFVASYKPAYYDKLTGRFYPPSKTITFNSKLTHNDGLLCQQFMKHEQKSFAEATEMIQNIVKQMEQALLSGSYQMAGLGVFTRRSDGFLAFEPEGENQLLQSAFGLTSFRFNELTGKVRGDARLKVVHSDHATKRVTRSLVRYAATVAAAFVLFMLLFPTAVNDTRLHVANVIPEFDSLNDGMPSASSSEKSAETVAFTPEEKDNKDEEVAMVTETDLPDASSEPTENSVVPKVAEHPINLIQSRQYHIIIASLTTREQALAFVERHCKTDFPGYTIIESNGRYRISIGTFTEKSIALPVLETFRDTNPGFSDAWLLTIKATV